MQELLTVLILLLNRLFLIILTITTAKVGIQFLSRLSLIITTCFEICVGWPASVHDARVYANSKLYQNAIQGKILNGNKRKIANVDVPVYLIGDPLSTIFMKPFDYNITQLQDIKQYNYRVSRAKIVTENAFGQLKARWRRLSKQNDMSVERVPTIIAACCILHNMCEVHSDSFNNDWLAELREKQLL